MKGGDAAPTVPPEPAPPVKSGYVMASGAEATETKHKPLKLTPAVTILVA